MKTHPKAAAAIALAVAGIFPTFGLSAQAQSPSASAPSSIATASVFSHDQLVVEHEILARQVQLALLGTNLADAANVTSSDRAALATIITNEEAALATDAANAAAATTEAQLKAVRQAMLVDERVYAVVTGQVDLVVHADNLTVAEAGYTGLVTELNPLVTELGSSRATRLLANITSEVTAATSLTTGVSANALSLSPSGYPGNQSQVKTWTFQLAEAQRDVSTAKNDVKAIEELALGMHRLPVRHRI